MRVAYVTPYYNGACDGRYGRFHDWVHTARDCGGPFDFDVYAFAASNPDGTLIDEPRGYLGEGSEIWGSKKNKAEFILNVPRIRRALQQNEYDLVHVLVMDTIVYPTTLSSIANVPVVIGPDIAGWSPVRTVPYWEQDRADWLENRLRYLLKNGISRAGQYDHAIAFSAHHRNILSSFGISEAGISVLEPGVHPRFATESRRERKEIPELLYVGDFSEHKGYPHFLRAVANLDGEVTARVVGAGDPDQKTITDLGLEDIVTVEGFVPRAQLPDYYRESDLVVIPTIDETAGTNVQIEALASGTPVVVSDCPGVNEYAPPDASVAFSPRTSMALSCAIERALDSLDSLTAGAEKHAPEFLADKPLAQLTKIYDRLIADQRV